MKEIAIIGPTASGKSDLAIEIALKEDAYIFSIDSLAIYKETDIVSAKPSKQQRNAVKHFGIDELKINEYSSVESFIELYKKAKKEALGNGKNLVIVGGTSFYLKRLIDGLSPAPKVDETSKKRVKEALENLEEAYKMLDSLDHEYMQKIAANDKYRIQKALEIYFASGMSPSKWFSAHPPKPIIPKIPIYEIAIERSVVRERIRKRTKKMLEAGLIDEVASLDKKYGRAPNAMKAIGIKETLEFLDGKIDKEELEELISIHTGQLAKRQQTFNKSQFVNVVSKPLKELQELLL